MEGYTGGFYNRDYVLNRGLLLAELNNRAVEEARQNNIQLTHNFAKCTTYIQSANSAYTKCDRLLYAFDVLVCMDLPSYQYGQLNVIYRESVMDQIECSVGDRHILREKLPENSDEKTEILEKFKHLLRNELTKKYDVIDSAGVYRTQADTIASAIVIQHSKNNRTLLHEIERYDAPRLCKSICNRLFPGYSEESAKQCRFKVQYCQHAGKFYLTQVGGKQLAESTKLMLEILPKRITLEANSLKHYHLQEVIAEKLTLFVQRAEALTIDQLTTDILRDFLLEDALEKALGKADYPSNGSIHVENERGGNVMVSASHLTIPLQVNPLLSANNR